MPCVWMTRGIECPSHTAIPLKPNLSRNTSCVHFGLTDIGNPSISEYVTIILCISYSLMAAAKGVA